MRNIRVVNVRGVAENSVRVDALGGARISDVTFDNVHVTLARHTRYPGSVYDNRPTKVAEPIEPHGTCGISVRHADRVAFRSSSIRWGPNPPDYYTHMLEAKDAPALDIAGLSGTSAHPEKFAAIKITP